jgi:NADH-quinone oxidoreductase E subunit
LSVDRFPHSVEEEQFEFEPDARAELVRIIEKYPVKRSALIPALTLAQKQNGFISNAIMRHVAEIFEIPPMEIWGVVTFYGMLKTQPLGEFHFQVCNNLSCALMGAARLLRGLEARLGVKAGHTREDGKFSIEKVECLGACGGAPCLQVNEDYFERATPEMIEEITTAFENNEWVSPIGADEVAPPCRGAVAAAKMGSGIKVAGRERLSG